MSSERTLITTKPTAVAPWARRSEVRELAERLQAFMPGGMKYTQSEALTLAQAALAHGLDPLNGELWYLKDRSGRPLGLMAGIKGHRRAAHRQMREDGGGNYWPEFEGPLDVDEKKALGIPTSALAFRCKIRDTQTLNHYTSEIERLMGAGLPWEVVESIVGFRPFTEGIGYAIPGEPSKMTTVQLAMKRAEAEALKRRFDLPFGVAVGTDSNADVMDGEFVVIPSDGPSISPEAVRRAAEETLEHNRNVLRGDPEERDGLVSRRSTTAPEAEPVPDPEEQGDDGNAPDPLQEAMEYVLSSGKVMGKLPDTELRDMLDAINALDKPKSKMLTVKRHCETLLAYLAAQVPAEKAETGDAEGNADNWPPQVIQAIINAGLAENTYNALGMLKHSDLTPADTVETAVGWSEAYRESRDAGGEVSDAAAVANAWLASREKQEELPL